MFSAPCRARTTLTEHTTVALVSRPELRKDNSEVGNQADRASDGMRALCIAPQQYVFILDQTRLRSMLMSDPDPERQPQAGLVSPLSKVQRLAFSA